MKKKPSHGRAEKRAVAAALRQILRVLGGKLNGEPNTLPTRIDRQLPINALWQGFNRHTRDWLIQFALGRHRLAIARELEALALYCRISLRKTAELEDLRYYGLKLPPLNAHEPKPVNLSRVLDFDRN